MRSLPLLAAALALPALSACYVDASDCTPTTTQATPADKVNVGTLGRSAVLRARLTTGSGPVAGRQLTFEVLDDDASVYTADATTEADGTARIDLKRADPGALLAIVRGDAFRASFDGDGTYCGSSDRAAFHAVRG